MARIKTALEIAMEKMGSIEVDEAKLRDDRLRTEGRTLAGKFLADDMMEVSALEKKLAGYGPEDLALVRRAANATALRNLVLPSGAEYKGRNLRLQALFEALDPGCAEAGDLLRQVFALEDQYWETMNGLLDRLKEQYQQAYDGEAPQAQDKEFLKVYQAQSAQVAARYRQALEQARARLERLLG